MNDLYKLKRLIIDLERIIPRLVASNDLRLSNAMIMLGQLKNAYIKALERQCHVTEKNAA